MKMIALITCMFKRYELTNKVFRYYAELKETLTDIDLIMVVAGSDGEIGKRIAENNGWIYTEAPNAPLNLKFESALQKAKEYNPDAVVVIGSDDIICQDIFKIYAKTKEQAIGFYDAYVYSEVYKQLCYWPGYRKSGVKERENETCGVGRYYSKELLNDLGWSLWFDTIGHNRGLDSLCQKRLKKCDKKVKGIYLGKNYIVDIKGNTNLTPNFQFNGDDHLIHNSPIQEHIESIIQAGKINNCFVARAVKFFAPRFCQKWGLVNHINPDKPLIVFGCYDAEDYNVVVNHSEKQPVVICWAGSDSLRHTMMKQLTGKKNVYHISASEFTNKDMEEVGFKYKYIPLSVGIYTDIKPEPLGDKIYIYTSKINPDFYGKQIYDKLIKKYGSDKFIIATHDKFTREELLQAYRYSFIGLRIVSHDGLSETVCEMGLMGRKMIYNGNEPNAVNYKDFDDICKIIDSEHDKRGKVQKELSEKMRKYLNIGSGWLDIDNYSEKITLKTHNIEFGYELIGCVTYAYWLHEKGLLKETISAKGSESLYYFSPKHTIDKSARSPENMSKVLQEDFPNIHIHNKHLDPRFKVPDYRKKYTNNEYRYDKPIVCICNRYNDEFGGPPRNYFSIDCLDKLFGLLKGYQVIYFATRIPEHLQDGVEPKKLGDYEYVKEHHPEVIIFQDVLKGRDWNTELLKIFSNCYKFITMNGGYSILASFFKCQNIIYSKPGSNQTREIDMGSFQRWYAEFNNSQIIYVDSYDRLFEKVKFIYTEEQPTVNILIRTCKRPNYFSNCIKAIESQDYKNINVIIGSEGDDETKNYLVNYKYRQSFYNKVDVEPVRPEVSESYGTYFPYNHYLDELGKKVGNGWVMYLDDDDILKNPDSVNKIVKAIKNTDSVVFWKVKIGNKIIPSSFGKPVVCDISGIGFLFHSKFINQVEWGYWKRGDYRVTSKLFKIGKPVFIDEVLTGTQDDNHKGVVVDKSEHAARIVISPNSILCKIINPKFGHPGQEVLFSREMAYSLDLLKFVEIVKL